MSLEYPDAKPVTIWDMRSQEIPEDFERSLILHRQPSLPEVPRVYLPGSLSDGIVSAINHMHYMGDVDVVHTLNLSSKHLGDIRRLSEYAAAMVFRDGSSAEEALEIASSIYRTLGSAVINEH